MRIGRPNDLTVMFVRIVWIVMILGSMADFRTNFGSYFLFGYGQFISCLKILFVISIVKLIWNSFDLI